MSVVTLPPTDLLTSDAAAPSLGIQFLAVDWQTRYDRAVRRKGTGRVLVWIGTPIAIAGWLSPLIIPLTSQNDCATGLRGPDCIAKAQRELTRALWTGVGIAAVGAAVATTGFMGIRSANREFLALDRERSPAASAVVGATSIPALPAGWPVEFRSFFGLERMGTLRVKADRLVFTPTSDEVDNEWQMPLAIVRDVKARRGGWVEVERVRVGREYYGGVRFRPTEIPADQLTDAIRSAAADHRAQEVR